MTIESGEAYGAHACASGADSSRQLRMTLPAVSHSVRLSRHATHAALTAWQLGHVDEAAACSYLSWSPTRSGTPRA